MSAIKSQVHKDSLRIPLGILTEACQEAGYTYEVVDEFSEALVKVSDGTRHFFAGMSHLGMYPLNSHYGVALVNDKAWSYQVLRKAGYQVPTGDYFFVTDEWREYRPSGKEITDAMAYATQLGYPVFVKPNDGSSGYLAELITDAAGLREHLAKIATHSQISLIQKPITWLEYRLFVVDGVVQFVYRRERPTVIGDGQQTVQELIEKHNAVILVEKHRINPHTDFVAKKLLEQGLTLVSILPLGQKLEVAAHANLAGGGKLCEYQEVVPNWVHDWASGVVAALGLRVAGIDVFMPTSLAEAGTENTKNWLIIEVNGNPNLAGIYTNGHAELAQKIWIQILHKFFKKT